MRQSHKFKAIIVSALLLGAFGLAYVLSIGPAPEKFLLRAPTTPAEKERIDVLASAALKPVGGAAPATTLTREQALALASWAMEPNRAHNERFHAVFTLGKSGEHTDILSAIALAEMPPASVEDEYVFEGSLRIEALKGIEKAGAADPRSGEAFRQIEERSPYAFLRQLARIGQIGLAQQKSLIREYVEAKTQGALR